MWPVPERNVNVHVVSGATIVTYFGLARMMRSAMRTRKSMPPAASITDAAMITARMISITSIGGDVGLIPNATTSTSSPTAPHSPRPTPLYRAPIQMAASTTMNCRKMDNVIMVLPGAAAAPDALLLEFRADQVFEREHLVPLFLRQQPLLADDDLVQRLAGLVAFARDLRALLVAQRRLQHGDDAERIQHHVARTLGVGGDAVDAVDAQAVDGVLH